MPSVDIGIDLGTANIILTLGDKGIVINEPSVVAYDKKKKQVLAVGSDAYKMIGRTPEYIVAVRPLENGVISDNYMTEVMIREFIRKVSKNMLIKPQVILCVPSSVTDVENRALIEAAITAGARKVYLIQEPIAALIGAGVDIRDAKGRMVVDIGGGTTDVAVVSFNGIVSSSSLKIAGSKFDDAIIKYIQQKFKVLIGEKTAENAKKSIADVFEPDGKKLIVKGRNLIRGLPESIEITDTDLYEALKEMVFEIIQSIKSVLEKTPPELVGDILSTGIILTGGGALIKGLNSLIEKEIGAPCHIADNPIESVARGVQWAFKYADELLDGFEKVSLYKYK